MSKTSVLDVLRHHKRAGDGNRTRVLSLGSPSRGSPRPAEMRKSPAQPDFAPDRWYSLLAPVCRGLLHEMVRIGLLHAVARSAVPFSASQAEKPQLRRAAPGLRTLQLLLRPFVHCAVEMPT